MLKHWTLSNKAIPQQDAKTHFTPVTLQCCTSVSDSQFMCCMPAGSSVIQVWYKACLYSIGLKPSTASAPMLPILTACSDGISLLFLCSAPVVAMLIASPASTNLLFLCSARMLSILTASCEGTSLLVLRSERLPFGDDNCWCPSCVVAVNPPDEAAVILTCCSFALHLASGQS